jgi:hypothetical protein
MIDRNSDLELLAFPFDQYQRYRDVREIVDHIQAHQEHKPVTMLDVGGSPTAWAFLAGYQVVTANLEAAESISLQCNGTRLPVRDACFDIVVSVDTLEHLKQDERQAFVQGLVRAARSYVIFTGPYANGYNEYVEQTLEVFLSESLGIEHHFLREHIRNGLPSLELCMHWLGQAGVDSIAIPSGYLHHWLPLMIIRYSLSSLSNGRDLIADLDRLYNLKRYWADHRPPAYRQLVVAAKENAPVPLSEIEELFKAPRVHDAPDLDSIIATWQALRWQKELQTREQMIDEKTRDIERLQALVSKYESGRFMRLMAALRDLVGTLKGSRDTSPPDLVSDS